MENTLHPEAKFTLPNGQKIGLGNILRLKGSDGEFGIAVCATPPSNDEDNILVHWLLDVTGQKEDYKSYYGVHLSLKDDLIDTGVIKDLNGDKEGDWVIERFLEVTVPLKVVDQVLYEGNLYVLNTVKQQIKNRLLKKGNLEQSPEITAILLEKENEIYQYFIKPFPNLGRIQKLLNKLKRLINWK